MTANQISYAMTVESKRHNEEAEALENNRLSETVRHNQAIEALQKDQLRIQEIYNSQMTGLKQQELEHRKYVDEMSLRIQKEQGEAKIALQEELNNITHMYNQQKAMLESEANAVKKSLKDLEQKKLEETIRYNDTMASLKSSEQDLTKWIQEKKLEYDYHALDIESGLKREDIQNARRNLQLTETRDLFNFGLASKDFELRELMNASQVANLEAQTKLTKSNKFWNPLRQISESYKDITQGLKNNVQAGTEIIKIMSFGGM